MSPHARQTVPRAGTSPLAFTPFVGNLVIGRVLPHAWHLRVPVVTARVLGAFESGAASALAGAFFDVVWGVALAGGLAAAGLRVRVDFGAAAGVLVVVVITCSLVVVV